MRGRSPHHPAVFPLRNLGAADQKATDLDGEGESGRRVPNFHDSFWNGHEFKNGLGPTDPAGQKCE